MKGIMRFHAFLNGISLKEKRIAQLTTLSQCMFSYKLRSLFFDLIFSSTEVNLRDSHHTMNSN